MNDIKRIFAIATFIIFCSCDKELFEDFIVKNNLTTSIAVKFETMNGDNDDMTIQPNAEVIIRQARGFGNSVHEIEISRWFKSFEITKDDTIKSRINYLLNENWEYNELSGTHAEYRLMVDSTHFNKAKAPAGAVCILK